MAFDFVLVGHNLTYFALFFAILLMSLLMLAIYICLLMRESDRKKRYHLINLAKRKGITLDLEALKQRNISTFQDDNNAEHPCPMAVPNLGIFVS